ncbi:hypothetical protein [Caldivirga sp.]|uniref:hypothetical protein n=1 Tax=Caldivirga sp. TaxID=2080243 RepID=UPI003D0AC4A4
MIYGLSILKFPALAGVGLFFIIDAILAIVAAAVILLNVSIMFIPVLVYSWVNYILLTESRVFPAPVLGVVIPVIDPSVILVFIIDVILISLVTVLWVLSRRR